ncbi:MAG: type I-C CRISPR-associated protein Cas8c/Csd1 [Dehalococcoidia bacterium]|nr:type I-C CRISPR-associated protein Cas8c/Csd1 [Dehalococcoidia bacterium]
MLLEQLVKHSQRLSLPPEMYIKTRIKWLIDLDYEGHLIGFKQTAGKETGGKNRGKKYSAPHALVSSGIVPKLLVGNSEYVFGLSPPEANEDKRQRASNCHREFVELVHKCASATGESSVHAVAKFLDNMVTGNIKLPEDFDSTDIFSFCVGDVIPFELPNVERFWADRQAIKRKTTQCLICGKLKPPAERHPFKIKGIPGGQASGMALVSVNNSSGESYCLKAALNSPICQYCAERYAKATDSLIKDEKSHLRIGPIIYLFWTRNDMEFDPASMLSDPQPEDVKKLLESVKTESSHFQIEPNDFYATALSASGGRVVVRDWVESTVANVQRNIARYFSMQQIDNGNGELYPIGLHALAGSLIPQKTGKASSLWSDIPPGIPKALMRTAISGIPLPKWLLFRAVNRNRAERRVTRSRAALIKMVLLSQKLATKEDMMQQINLDNHEPAYLCGRLLAVLEAIQREALPGINTTVVDRFYGTASTAPAGAFSQLMKMAQSHLAKLRRDKPGAHIALQQKLEEIQSKLSDFPRTLTLEQQGLFSLGYYHQRAADHAAARAHKQARHE